MNDFLGALKILAAILIGFIIVAAIIHGAIWLKIGIKNKSKCLNCGGDIKKENLFCPWCHCDLRGGGKD